MAKQYKVEIEINSPGDGRLFLNYWNWRNGDDVVCEIIDGKLIEQLEGKEITFSEFIKMVETRIKD